MRIDLVHQQSLAPRLGDYLALRACVPACFYMLARAHGYLESVDFNDFAAGLDWEHSRTPELGWIRPKLSSHLRERHNLPIVTWNLAGGNNRDGMLKGGHIATKREADWFNANVAKSDIRRIVSAGTPVIVTVKPGFGANQSGHSVILSSLTGDIYNVADPDQRNPRQHYSVAEINQFLALDDGAASVILPPV